MLKTIRPFLAKYKWPSILAPITIIFEVLLEIQIPFLMAQILDEGVAGKDMGFIVHIGLVMIGLACASLLFGVLSGAFAAKGAMGFGAELRKGLFDKIQSFSFANIDRFSTPSLITRMTTDITNTQMAYMMVIRVLVRAPVMLIAAAVMATRISNDLVRIFLVSIPLLVIVLFIIMRKSFPLFNDMLTKTDLLNADIQENLIAIRVVKAFNRQKFENNKFGDSNNALTEAMLRAQMLIISVMPVMMLVMNGTILAVIWYGGNLIIGGVLLTGELLSFITYCTQILMSLMMIAQVFMMVTISLSSLKRICEVLNEDSNITDDQADANLRVPDGSISFGHVYFKYSEKAALYILRDIELNIKSGENIGIIGGTGSSKSSLVQLIPRLYAATAGIVKVGGHDVADYTLAHLRDSVGMVLQKNVLFSGTIAENLRWGNANATEDELMDACQRADIADFIQALPEGLATNLGQGAVNLSGGQKQRLCIARALLKKPKILILDDSTSAVDMATDARIRESLKKNDPDMTTLMIAQRISSVEDCDRVIVMDNGRVSDFDTPKALMAHNEIYKHIVSSQRKEQA